MSILKQFKGLEVSYDNNRTISLIRSLGISSSPSPRPRPMPVQMPVQMPAKVQVQTQAQAPSPIKQQEANSTTKLIIFTDGACTNNQKQSGQKAGYAIVCPNHPHHNFGGPLPHGDNKTNNRAEMAGLIKAFSAARAIDPTGIETLYLYSDSMLLIDGATKWLQGWKRNGWKKRDGSQVLNQDLWKQIDSELQKRITKFTHVRAHTGGADWASRWNAEADRLATSSVA